MTVLTGNTVLQVFVCLLACSYLALFFDVLVWLFRSV